MFVENFSSGQNVISIFVCHAFPTHSYFFIKQTHQQSKILASFEVTHVSE